MASLFESIIQQNLSVLTRGHTLMPYVLLLGGPNTYIKGMVECWKANIPPIWAERGVELPPCDDPADLIIVPQNAQYFAASAPSSTARPRTTTSACTRHRQARVVPDRGPHRREEEGRRLGPQQDPEELASS
jgi:activator of 2-hydroxyglutaryl-CoA dehydratase